MVLFGHQIGKKLIEGLGLPKNTVSFELRCAANEVVSVRCEYLVEGEEAFDTLINDYQLVAVGGTIRAKPFNFDAWMAGRKEAAHKALMARNLKIERLDRQLAWEQKTRGMTDAQISHEYMMGRIGAMPA